MNIKECLCTCRTIEEVKTNDGNFFIKCPSCGIQGPVCETIDKAITQWNHLIKRPMFVNRYPQIPGLYFHKDTLAVKIKYYSAKRIKRLKGDTPSKYHYWSDEPIFWPHVFSSTSQSKDLGICSRCIYHIDTEKECSQFFCDKGSKFQCTEDVIAQSKEINS